MFPAGVNNFTEEQDGHKMREGVGRLLRKQIRLG
jgi:hypothetical protein